MEYEEIGSLAIGSSTEERVDGPRTVNWGILGSSRVAKNVIAPGIRDSTNGRVYAVASRSPERASEYGRIVGAETTYGSYEDLLRDEVVDAVYIPLPNSLHKEWTIMAAEYGKHVPCEKPLALRAPDAEEMVDTCERKGVLLMEAFAHRFHPQNLVVKEEIARGRIGRVTAFTAVHSSAPPTDPSDIRLRKDLGGGVLADKGCYCVNTARFVFGAEPAWAFAFGEYYPNGGVDKRMTVQLGFPGGGVALLDTSFALSNDAYYQSYEVQGQDGRIWVPFGFAQRETYRLGNVVPTTVHFVKTLGLGHEIDVLTVGGAQQWRLEVEYFASAVLASSKKLAFPAENGLANARVMESIYKSAQERRIVQID